jgi:hypothetical protein
MTLLDNLTNEQRDITISVEFKPAHLYLLSEILCAHLESPVFFNENSLPCAVEVNDIVTKSMQSVIEILNKQYAFVKEGKN